MTIPFNIILTEYIRNIVWHPSYSIYKVYVVNLNGKLYYVTEHNIASSTHTQIHIPRWTDMCTYSAIPCETRKTFK